ncbi:MAG: glycosyltransferase [Anaerolineae bacterium]|nr:glycosyltransferase [Anaerolineae bacterium]
MHRILIAAHGFPPTHSAGAERRAERMAQWFARQGHSVQVFAVEKLDAPEFRVETREQDGFPVHRLYYDVKAGDHFHNLYDYPPVGEAFRALIERESFDLVHIISGYLLGGQVIHAARERGLPVVLTLTEYWFMCARLNLFQATDQVCSGPESDSKCARCLLEDLRRYRLPAKTMPKLMDVFWKVADQTPLVQPMTQQVAERRVVLKQALESAQLVICPSHFLMDKFNEFHFDASRFTYLRQGLNVPDPLPTPVPSQGTLRLGYVGQVKSHKGVDLLVDAAIALLKAGRKVSLDLWGSLTEDPDYVARLRTLSEPYPAIRWNGRYTGAKVWDVLANLDALVIPSRWYENSPNTILEAYAMRLPVIGTNLGGMAELIEHDRTGLLFHLNDAADLQRQIERLLDEPQLLDRLRQSIPPVKTVDQEMRETLELYQHILAG